ncbi:MAG: hypothetical protein MK198_09245 [Gracilimonas sp.]|uniref:hypothetical protein n=1 Tax=Gracilimonas sp. TaxID=1974203 RepID=UPI003751196F|nr:hypothetical protein [Gracilimonas sp.]
MSTKAKKTVWFGMKVTPKEKEKIKRLARQRGVSQKQVMIDLIEKETEGNMPAPEPGSFLEAAKDLAGIGKGPGDASTNPEYMKDFGK